MNVRVIIEKEGDQGYEHFNKVIPVELIPKEGEIISLYYPDGHIMQDKKVSNVYKSFEQDGVIVIVKVINVEIDDFLGGF